MPWKLPPLLASQNPIHPMVEPDGALMLYDVERVREFADGAFHVTATRA
jgi:hypothetical protein